MTYCFPPKFKYFLRKKKLVFSMADFAQFSFGRESREKSFNSVIAPNLKI